MVWMSCEQTSEVTLFYGVSSVEYRIDLTMKLQFCVVSSAKIDYVLLITWNTFGNIRIARKEQRI